MPMTEGLLIALQHPSISTDAQLLSAVASVCSSWRSTVSTYAAGRPCCCDVTLIIRRPHRDALLATVSSLAAWLHQHAGLMRSLNIFTASEAADIADDPSAQQLLGEALRQPAAQPLQLQAYRSDCMGNGNILSSVPAGSLRELFLELPSHGQVPGGSLPVKEDLVAAFGRLTGLQSLSLVWKQQLSMSPACFAALNNLRQLTSLELAVGVSQASVQQLQQVLPQLPVQRLQLRCTSESVCGWDLSGLTQLTELQLKLHNRLLPYPDTRLPAQLKVLHLVASLASIASNGRIPQPREFDLTSLQQLESLHIAAINCLSRPEQDSTWAAIQQLPALKHLSLAYPHRGQMEAFTDCSTWPQMPQLQQLHIEWTLSNNGMGAMTMTGGLLDIVLQSVAQTTQLTSLKINICADDFAAWSGALETPVKVFGFLTSLTRLQELRIGRGPHGDGTDSQFHMAMVGSAVDTPQQLTGLTALTLLQLKGLGHAIDDEIAVAIAGSLTGLRQLDLRGCEVHGEGASSALLSLPHLTQFEWDH